MPVPVPAPVLTIELARFGKDQYRIELRFDKPEDATEKPALLAPAEIDYQALRESNLSPQDYGEALRKVIFSQPEVINYFNECTANSNGAMRLRLEIHNSAPELHDLRWETMRSPNGRKFLALNSNQPFSRFLASRDWQRVDLRPKGKLKALVVIANPLGLERPGGFPLGDSKLGPVPVEAERLRALAALAGLPAAQISFLVSQVGMPGLVNIETLKEALRKGPDIVYLVAHGALLTVKANKKPYLALEKPPGDPKVGEVERVSGEDLAEFFTNLPVERRPRLVVLASCQSGGKGQVPGGPAGEDERSYDGGALSALGPLLVDGGIPAVVAMQGDIKQETIARFMPDFFSELLTHGQVDKAMAIAREKVKGAAARDWDAPVLYLRLRDGRLWYEPFISSTEEPKTFWRNLVNSIQKDPTSPCKCIPVLGYGLLETVTGSLIDAAQAWAREAHYPLAPYQQQELPMVAQFLLKGGNQAPRDTFEGFIRQQAMERYAQFVGPDTGQTVKDLLSTIEDLQYDQSSLVPEKDPYWILANLPFNIYINASPDNLLETALRKKGKEPQVVHYAWNPDLKVKAGAALGAKIPEPTVDCPLLFYLFGAIDQTDTWVLTEDDYFEYLMHITELDGILDQVKVSFTNNALLFLGFRISEWNFRVLFRSILSVRRMREIGAYPIPYRYLAVQLEPGDYNLNPPGARQYLERYFSNNIFNLYWGNPESFLSELWAQWKDIKKVNP